VKGKYEIEYDESGHAIGIGVEILNAFKVLESSLKRAAPK